MSSYNDFYNITPRTDVTYNEVFYSSKLQERPKETEKNNIKPFKYFSDDALSNKKCIIVIPVYKQEQTEFEILNMSNTVRKFKGKYPMLLLCHNDIKTSLFNIKYDYDFSYIKLSKLNFLNKNTYSFLLERPSYYEMFSNWEYQMIVQMDVWIFGDGYDIDKFFGYTYVGAPWNEEYVKKTFGLTGVELAGNGGLSLRNNKQLADYLRNSKFKDNKYKTVEDQFISIMLYKEGNSVPVELANRFSVDNYPEFWHKRLSGDYSVMPFGVHLPRPEMRDYWMKYISTDGIDIVKQNQPRYAISLTSFGDRLVNDAPVVIKNILRQSFKVSKIILTVYKDDAQRIPQYFKELQSQNILDIIIAENNYRSHLKYYYAMVKYPDYNIITIDDDQLYKTDMIVNLVAMHIQFPNCVVANRCHCIRYDDEGNMLPYEKWISEIDSKGKPSDDLFATGVGGVLYPAGIFNMSQFTPELINEFITTDDLLLKEIEYRNNIKVVCTGKSKHTLSYMRTSSSVKNRLCDINTTGQKINNTNIKKMTIKRVNRKICYTVISGRYDRLHEPRFVTPGWTYICFTDQKFTSKVWQIKPIPRAILNDDSLNQIKRQRVMKISPHKLFSNYDTCIWVDGNLLITGNLDDFVAQFPGYKLVVPQHPARKCIYKEARVIVNIKKDKPENIDPMVDMYRKEGFPDNFGLAETNVIIRKNDQQVNAIMDMWEEMLRKYSHRDQMSFNYVLWKLGLNSVVLHADNKIRYKYLRLYGHGR